MSRTEDVWMIVPAYNEAGVLAKTLSTLRELGYPVVLIDDCSTDTTSWVARAIPGVCVCRHPVNLGQGAALQTGIEFALSRGARAVVTFDADGQHNPDDIPRMLAPIESGQADVALGSRFLSGANTKVPPVRRVLLWGAVIFERWITGLRLTDAHNGFRCFSREAATAIRIRQNRMAHASEILAEIAARKLRYVEVPTRILYTDYSRSKGQGSIQFFNILWELLSGRIQR